MAGPGSINRGSKNFPTTAYGAAFFRAGRLTDPSAWPGSTGMPQKKRRRVDSQHLNSITPQSARLAVTMNDRIDATSAHLFSPRPPPPPRAPSLAGPAWLLGPRIAGSPSPAVSRGQPPAKRACKGSARPRGNSDAKGKSSLCEWPHEEAGLVAEDISGRKAIP